MPDKPPAPALVFFRPTQALFKEGEASKSLFIIKKGTVAIRKMKGPDHVELARIYANEVLGELSFFDHSPRSASAVALTEVEALEIKFDSLEKLYSTVPEYMKTIVASLADRLRKANELIKRIQKDVVRDVDSIESDPESGPTASEVLASTLETVPTGEKGDSGT